MLYCRDLQRTPSPLLTMLTGHIYAVYVSSIQIMPHTTARASGIARCNICMFPPSIVAVVHLRGSMELQMRSCAYACSLQVGSSPICKATQLERITLEHVRDVRVSQFPNGQLTDPDRQQDTPRLPPVSASHTPILILEAHRSSWARRSLLIDYGSILLNHVSIEATLPPLWLGHGPYSPDSAHRPCASS